LHLLRALVMNPLSQFFATNAPFADSSEARSTQPQGMLRDYRYRWSEISTGLAGSLSFPVRRSGGVAASGPFCIEGGMQQYLHIAAAGIPSTRLSHNSISRPMTQRYSFLEGSSAGSPTNGSWLSSGSRSGRRLLVTDVRAVDPVGRRCRHQPQSS
jgi:hypothetical protein